MGKPKSTHWSLIDRPLTAKRERDRSRSQSSHASGTSHGSRNSSRSIRSHDSRFSRTSRSSRRSSMSGRSMSTRTRRWLNVKRSGLGEGFATGFDLLSEEEQTRRKERRKRFGVTRAVERLPVQKMGKMDVLEEMRYPKGDEELRRDILHVYGVDLLDTDDIRTIFFGYGVKWVEWINDSSCNVAFEDDYTVKRILKFMSEEDVIVKKEEAEEVDAEMMDDGDGDGSGAHDVMKNKREGSTSMDNDSIGTSITKELTTITSADLSRSGSGGSDIVQKVSMNADRSPPNSAPMSPAAGSGAPGRFENAFPLDPFLEWKQIKPMRVRGDFYQFYMRMATEVDERPSRPNPKSQWSINVLSKKKGARNSGLLARALKQSAGRRLLSP